MPSPKSAKPKPKSAPQPKPKHAPKPKSLSAAFEEAGTRLQKCQVKSCTSDFAASKVVPLKVTAELASIYQGQRSDAEFKRLIRDTLTRAATRESQVALTRCSVAKCRRPLVNFYATGAALTCKEAKVKAPRTHCIVPPKEDGLTVDRAVRHYQALLKQSVYA